MPVKVVPPVLVPQKSVSMQDIGPITVMSGFMTKKTRSRNKWKQRWWQLMDNGFLFYFKDDSHLKILGQIDIARTCYDVRLGSEKCRVSFPRAAPSCCCISFAVLKRTYHVYTPTAYEAEKWYQALFDMSRIINRKIVAGVEHRKAPDPAYPSRPPSCPPNYKATVTRVQAQQKGLYESCKDIAKIEFVKNGSVSSNLSSVSRNGMAQSVPDYLHKIEDDSVSLGEELGLDSRLWLDGSPPANSQVHPQNQSSSASKASWTNSSEKQISHSPAQDLEENQTHVTEPFQDSMESQLQGVEEPLQSSMEGDTEEILYSEENMKDSLQNSTEQSEVFQTSTDNQFQNNVEPLQASLNQSEENEESLKENQSEENDELLQSSTESQFKDQEEPSTESHSEDTKKASIDCHQLQDTHDEPFPTSQESPESQLATEEPTTPSEENHESCPQDTEESNNHANESEAIEELKQPSRLSDSVADLSPSNRPTPLARTKIHSKSSHSLASNPEPLAKPVPKPRKPKPQMKRATTEVQVAAQARDPESSEFPATASPKGTGSESNGATAIRKKAKTMPNSSRPSIRQRNNSMPSGEPPRKLRQQKQQEESAIRRKKSNRSHKRTRSRSRRLSPPSSPPPPPCPVQDRDAPLLLPLLPPTSSPSPHSVKDRGPPSFVPTLPQPAGFKDRGPPDFIPSPPPADDNTVSTMV